MHKTGSDDWWQHISGPQIEAVDGAYRVTFWWRDPAGNETSSAIQRVWIYITGVTDHHKNAVPQTLQRIPGTDAWCWQTTLSPTWRGSYCFIPTARDDDFSPQLFNGDGPDRALLREGWRRLLPQAIADPLNPQSWKGGAATRSPRWSCRTPPNSPAGRCAMNLIRPRSASNGRASASATADGYGFTPPATRSRRRAGWRSCWMASSGPKACRYGRRWRA